jgi:hypothetical protein
MEDILKYFQLTFYIIIFNMSREYFTLLSKNIPIKLHNQEYNP